MLDEEKIFLIIESTPNHIRVECLTIPDSLSFHYHGHHLLHTHLSACTTLNKIGKKRGKEGKREKKKRLCQYVHFFKNK